MVDNMTDKMELTLEAAQELLKDRHTIEVVDSGEIHVYMDNRKQRHITSGVADEFSISEVHVQPEDAKFEAYVVLRVPHDKS